jgi:hypothetical protein
MYFTVGTGFTKPPHLVKILHFTSWHEGCSKLIERLSYKNTWEHSYLKTKCLYAARALLFFDWNWTQWLTLRYGSCGTSFQKYLPRSHKYLRREKDYAKWFKFSYKQYRPGQYPTGNNWSKAYLVNMILISLNARTFHQLLWYLRNYQLWLLKIVWYLACYYQHCTARILRFGV